MNPEEPYAPTSFVKAHLLQAPLYREEAPLWDALLQARGDVTHYFRELGQDLAGC